MTPIGKRDKRIIFERSTPTPDGYGEDIPQWGRLGEEQSAAVYYGLGTERREAARQEGTQTANFNCRVSETTNAVKISDRIVLRGGLWDIVGISPIGRAEIEFTAKRAL